MRKSLVALLTVGLLLLGVTPVWAAGQITNNMALPPEALELTDQELSIVEGEGWFVLGLGIVALILLSSLKSCSVSAEVSRDGVKFESDVEYYEEPRWMPGR